MSSATVPPTVANPGTNTATPIQIIFPRRPPSEPDQFGLFSGLVLFFYLQQLRAKERTAAAAELLMQLAVARKLGGVGE